MAEVKDIKGKIALIGVGNGGCNVISWAANEFYGKQGLNTDHFVMLAVESDSGKLRKRFRNHPHQDKVNIIHLGKRNNGMGTGGDPRIGAELAKEKALEYQGVIRSIGPDHGIVFLLGCLGGGSTGAIPVIAKAFKEKGIPVISLLMMPPAMEGSERIENAGYVLRETQQKLKIPCFVLFNQNVYDDDVPLSKLYDKINALSFHGACKALRVIFQEDASLINVDRNDLLNLISNRERLFIGTSSHGEPEGVLNKLLDDGLQDTSIISDCTSGIPWFNGSWKSGEIKAITLGLKRRLSSEGAHRIKNAVNEIEGREETPEDKWVSVILAAPLKNQAKNPIIEKLLEEERSLVGDKRTPDNVIEIPQGPRRIMVYCYVPSKHREEMAEVIVPHQIGNLWDALGKKTAPTSEDRASVLALRVELQKIVNQQSKYSNWEVLLPKPYQQASSAVS